MSRSDQSVVPWRWLALLLTFTLCLLAAPIGGAAALTPTAAGPAAPTLMYPADRAQVDLVAFQWYRVSGAVTYEFQASRMSDFRATEIDQFLVGTRLVLDKPMVRREYWWRVRGIDAVGTVGNWSAARSVSNVWIDPNTGKEARPNNVRFLDAQTGQTLPLAAPNTTPCAAFPDPGALVQCAIYRMPANMVLLSWDPVPGAASYLVEWASSATFETPDGSDSTFRNRWTIPDVQIPSGTYFRVTAVDLEGGKSTPSSVPTADNPSLAGLVVQAIADPAIIGDPTLDPALPAPLLGPADGFIAPDMPVLTWAAVRDATSYLVRVFEDRSMTTTPVAESTVEGLVATFTDLLPESDAGGSYYWYVLPCTASGCAAASLVLGYGFNPPRYRSFSRMATPLVGLNAGLVADQWPTLTWTRRGTAGDTGCAFDSTVPAKTGCPGVPQYEVEILDTGQTHLTMANEWVLSELNLLPGTYSWRVRVVGDGNQVPLWSATSTFTVPTPARYDILSGNPGAAPAPGPTQATQAKLAPTVTLTASPNSGLRVGHMTKLTAVLDPVRATGSVTFYDSGHRLGTATLRAGRAELTTKRLYGGTQDLKAVYSGSAELRDSTSAVVRVRVTDSKRPARPKVTLTRRVAGPQVKVRASDAGGVRTARITTTINGTTKVLTLPIYQPLVLPAGKKGKRACARVAVSDWAGNWSRTTTKCVRLR